MSFPVSETPIPSQENPIVFIVGYYNHPFSLEDEQDMICAPVELHHNQMCLAVQYDQTLKKVWVHEPEERKRDGIYWATFSTEPNICCADCEEGLRGGASRGC